jgi:hypothetical protein
MKKAGLGYLKQATGPAIAMSKLHHEDTFSHGRKGPRGKVYRTRQTKLIMQGYFKQAMLEDIDEVRLKFPGVYDEGLSQMLLYFSLLESTGYVK